MKRLCDEHERKVLFKNRKMVLKGINHTLSNCKYPRIYAGIVGALILILLTPIPLAHLFGGNKIVFWTYYLISFTAPAILIYKSLDKNSVKGNIKRCLKSNQLSVNGATIVGINTKEGTILYIEDDVYNDDGRPIIFEHPALAYEMRSESKGERLIVVYCSDTTIQLMRLNDSLARFISSYSNAYPLLDDIESYNKMPHPSALNISYSKRALTEKEKEEFRKKYIRKIRKNSMVQGVYIVLISLIVFRFPKVYERIIFEGIALFIGFMALLGTIIGRRAAQFVSIQEVLFLSNQIIDHKFFLTKHMTVYQWINGIFLKFPHGQMNAPRGTKYGDVLYLLINTKGREVFVRKSDMKIV